MEYISTIDSHLDSIFNSKIKKDKNFELHFLNLEFFSQEFDDYMSKHFVAICEGIESQNTFDVVKKRVVEFFEKKDKNTTMGAIAEFIMHLYLKSLGYRQECTYFNLEEGSIKKGFDGYYTREKVEWILESKSGYIDNQAVTHPTKIGKAYQDLMDKFSGKVKNNPWKNAYNHASMVDIIPDQKVRDKLRKLAADFTNNKYPSIEDYYLIPASTIFLNGTWTEPDYLEIESILEKDISTYKFKKMIVICLTKKSIEMFLDYIKS